MRISDLVAQRILELLQNSAEGMAEIQRNELAEQLGCVPSQINYVLTSRFTPEQGYIIESRRGGGGYIRITRVQVDRSSAIMHLINSIGDSLDGGTARVLIDNLEQRQITTPKAAKLMCAVMGDACYPGVSPTQKGQLRAAMLKQMLLQLI